MLLLLLTLWASSSSHALDRCSDAPEEGIRIICEQIQQWDKNSRTVAPTVRPLNSAHTALLESSSRVPSSFYDCMDIPCLCGYFEGLMNNGWCRLPNGQFLGKALRKEYRQMTDQERSNYHAATWKIRNDGSYGDLSRIHSNFTIAAGAHSGPAFLPWHREFIKRMEFALRKIDPTISLPYWDSTLDNNIPNPLDSILWGEELMGYPSMENTLLSGSFSHWRTDDNARYVRRCLGEQAALMNEEHIKSFMAFTNINDVLASTAARTGCPRTASWSSLEFTHGNPHVYVGGDMLVTTNSTNDPLFFLHHSFIDLLWENWRQSKQSPIERESQYPENDAACYSMSHFSNSIMQPFVHLTNADGLSNKYADLNDYLARPTCSLSNPDCKSRFLFCDISHGQPRCAARIRRGGNCTGFTNGEFPCYEGQCLRNICTETDIQTSTTLLTTSASITPTTRQTLPGTSSTVESTTLVTITSSPVTSSPTTSPMMSTTISSTLRPPTTALKACLNDNHCCQGWADYGECKNNPGYMNKHCMASCTVCRPSFDLSIECDDRATDCDVRIANIGCSTPWMFENCRQKCKMCNQTRKWQCTLMGTSTSPSVTTTTSMTRLATLTTVPSVTPSSTTTRITPITSSTISFNSTSTKIPVNLTVSTTASTRTTTTPVRTTVPQLPPTTKPTCWNYHYCCEAWAFKDYCTSKNNSAYMNHYCAPSCSTCKKGSHPPHSSNQACQDNHPTCEYWASKNECTLSSEFMFENCKLSCGKCDLLNMKARLDLCGYRNQLRDSESSAYKEFFEINPWEMIDFKLMRKLHKAKTEFTGV
ncbi:unnamed protein product [Auanema sp. JU1783]|nr:unnamed protein product [Auanema sp. JU1783]